MRIANTARLLILPVLLSGGLSARPKPPPVQNHIVATDLKLGPVQRLSGIYFTNFENSNFTECNTQAACAAWPAGEQATVICRPDACDDLKARIRKLNGSSDHWGKFSIMFVGQRGMEHYPKRSMNDSGRRVLMRRILRFKLVASESSPR